MPKAKYVGAGNYVDGVPARDLDAAEWAALSEALQSKALAAGTHKLISPKSPKAKAQEERNG